jgi:hypothetical protein
VTLEGIISTEVLHDWRKASRAPFTLQLRKVTENLTDQIQSVVSLPSEKY